MWLRGRRRQRKRQAMLDYARDHAHVRGPHAQTRAGRWLEIIVGVALIVIVTCGCVLLGVMH